MTVRILLLRTIVLALAPLAVTESGELLILATYPDSDNFSSIVCTTCTCPVVLSMKGLEPNFN